MGKSKKDLNGAKDIRSKYRDGHEGKNARTRRKRKRIWTRFSARLKITRITKKRTRRRNERKLKKLIQKGELGEEKIRLGNDRGHR